MAKRKPMPPRSGRGGGGQGAGGMGGGFGGGGMGGFGGGAGGLMAQVQKLQEEMAAAQESLKEEIVEASVGGGMVTVRMTATQDLVGIEIKPDVVDPDDVEMLQDLLLAAFNEATEKAKAATEERMAPFSSMLDMGGLGGMFG
jgi:nucleoid-associated protein EbfC